MREAKAIDVGQIESSFVVLQKEKSEELELLEERKQSAHQINTRKIQKSRAESRQKRRNINLSKDHEAPIL